MSRHTVPLAIIGVFVAAPAAAQVYAPQVYSRQIEGQPQTQVRYAAAPRGQMGGGFIEFLFNATGEPPRQQRRRMPADPYAGRRYEMEPALAPRGSALGYPQPPH